MKKINNLHRSGESLEPYDWLGAEEIRKQGLPKNMVIYESTEAAVIVIRNKLTSMEALKFT